MKHKGANAEYAQQRINDLLDLYRQYIANTKFIRMPQLYQTIVRQPAPRFYVSDIRASLVVSAIMRGEARLDDMFPLKKEMYLEIYRRVRLLMKEQPFTPISKLCAEVLVQPAPQFYLTAGSAKIMICKERKRRKALRQSRR